MENEFYRPVNIEFKITAGDNNVPEILGNFKTAEEASKHMASNFTFMNRQLTVARFMDAIEKESKRREYRETLEDILPKFEKDLIQAEINLTDAKKRQKDALEAYNVTMNHAKELAYEVKRGLMDMDLDEKYTYRVASNGRYYFYTFIDQQLKLCKIMDIPEHEKQELWNAMAENQVYFEHLTDRDSEFGRAMSRLEGALETWEVDDANFEMISALLISAAENPTGDKSTVDYFRSRFWKKYPTQHELEMKIAMDALRDAEPARGTNTQIKEETGAKKFKVFATGPDGVEKEIDLAKLEKMAKKAGRPKKDQ